MSTAAAMRAPDYKRLLAIRPGSEHMAMPSLFGINSDLIDLLVTLAVFPFLAERKSNRRGKPSTINGQGV